MIWELFIFPNTRFLWSVAFSLVCFSFQLIYIPGDNDIGGEGADLMEAWKIQRFDNHFQDSIDSASYKQAQILKVLESYFSLYF